MYEASFNYFKKNSNNLELGWDGSSNIGGSGFATTKTIPLSKYTKLHVIWDCTRRYSSGSKYYHCIRLSTGLDFKSSSTYSKREEVFNISSQDGILHFYVVGHVAHLYQLYLSKE